MSEKLLVPDIGEFENVEVIELLVKEGQKIKKNDPIVTIESDKSSVEIPSTIEGKVEKIDIKIGDKVSKGDLLLTVSSLQKLRKNFKSSLVLELYWENKIDYSFVENENMTKISLLTLFRKFFSKKIRSMLS